jgi:hypothetical protein
VPLKKNLGSEDTTCLRRRIRQLIFGSRRSSNEYLKIQPIPQRKHNTSQFQKINWLILFKEIMLFSLRIIRNPYEQMQSYRLLNQAVHPLTTGPYRHSDTPARRTHVSNPLRPSVRQADSSTVNINDDTFLREFV